VIFVDDQELISGHWTKLGNYVRQLISCGGKHNKTL